MDEGDSNSLLASCLKPLADSRGAAFASRRHSFAPGQGRSGPTPGADLSFFLAAAPMPCVLLVEVASQQGAAQPASDSADRAANCMSNQCSAHATTNCVNGAVTAAAAGLTIIVAVMASECGILRYRRRRDACCGHRGFDKLGVHLCSPLPSQVLSIRHLIGSIGPPHPETCCMGRSAARKAR